MAETLSDAAWNELRAQREELEKIERQEIHVAVERKCAGTDVALIFFSIAGERLPQFADEKRLAEFLKAMEDCLEECNEAVLEICARRVQEAKDRAVARAKTRGVDMTYEHPSKQLTLDDED